MECVIGTNVDKLIEEENANVKLSYARAPDACLRRPPTVL